MFKNLSCNMGNRFQRGALEGRKLRVVVKEVLKAQFIALYYLFFERYDFLYLFFLFSFFFFLSIQDDPFVIKEKSKDGVISFKGYCIDLLEELARNLHFTYDIYTTPDGNYGAEAENGTWNGVIGELINRVGIKQLIHSLPRRKNRGQTQKIPKTITKKSFFSFLESVLIWLLLP